MERRADFRRLLVADQPERDLGGCLGGDHGLRPRAGIAAPDAVHIASRPRHDLLDDEAVFFAGGNAEPDLPEKPLRRQVERLPLLAHRIGKLLHAVVEAGNGDPAVVVMDGGDDLGEHANGIPGGAAEHARMQVAVGRLDLDLLVEEAAQRRGDGRRLRVPHAGVADEGDFGGKLAAMGLDPGRQMLGAAFLLALDQERHVEGQRSRHRLPRAAGLDERHHLAFVVAGAARNDRLAPVRERGDPRLEGRRLPEVERIDRLDVVVTIEQHAAAMPAHRRALGEDDGMAIGRVDLGGDVEG